MEKIVELELRKESISNELKSLRKEMEVLINSQMKNDIVASIIISSWDINVNLSHPIHNWTSFVTVNYNSDSRYTTDTEHKLSFNFSHGSGGFNEIKPELRLETTIDIFETTSNLMGITAELEKIMKKYSSVKSKVYQVGREIEDFLLQQKKEVSEKKLKESFELISFDTAISSLKENKELNLTWLSNGNILTYSP